MRCAPLLLLSACALSACFLSACVNLLGYEEPSFDPPASPLLGRSAPEDGSLADRASSEAGSLDAGSAFDAAEASPEAAPDTSLDASPDASPDVFSDAPKDAPFDGFDGWTFIPHCHDAVPDQGESDVDCGGECQKCPTSWKCKSNTDCVSNTCSAPDGGTCQ